MAEDDCRNESDDVFITAVAIFCEQKRDGEFSYVMIYCVTDQRILRPQEYVEMIHSNLQEVDE